MELTISPPNTIRDRLDRAGPTAPAGRLPRPWRRACRSRAGRSPGRSRTLSSLNPARCRGRPAPASPSAASPASSSSSRAAVTCGGSPPMIQQAGRQFPQPPAERVPVLVDQHDVVLVHRAPGRRPHRSARRPPVARCCRRACAPRRRAARKCFRHRWFRSQPSRNRAQPRAAGSCSSLRRPRRNARPRWTAARESPPAAAPPPCSSAPPR